MSDALALGRRLSLDRTSLYEVVLQSYLFLGFPRMLLAMDPLDRTFSGDGGSDGSSAAREREIDRLYKEGLALCRRVYGSSFEPQKMRVESSAPDVFRWMIVEGYGKVLGRPGLDDIERELASVAFLMMEGYEQQLYSHMRGALNVGASAELLSNVIEDIGPGAGNGHSMAQSLLTRLEAR